MNSVQWCYGSPDLGINEQWVYILMCQNVFNYEAQSEMKFKYGHFVSIQPEKDMKKLCEEFKARFSVLKCQMTFPSQQGKELVVSS